MVPNEDTQRRFVKHGIIIGEEYFTGYPCPRGKLVFASKLNTKGQTIAFKCRWVVPGFQQQPGVHYSRTYAAVVNMVTNRILFAIGTACEWKSRIIDYVGAFLNDKTYRCRDPLLRAATGLRCSQRYETHGCSYPLESLWLETSRTDLVQHYSGPADYLRARRVGGKVCRRRWR